MKKQATINKNVTNERETHVLRWCKMFNKHETQPQAVKEAESGV